MNKGSLGRFFEKRVKEYGGQLSKEIILEFNGDDYLPKAKLKVYTEKELPEHIVIYGKGSAMPNTIYLNYVYTPIFKNIKCKIDYYHPSSLPITALCVGLPRDYREMHIQESIEKSIDFFKQIFKPGSKITWEEVRG